MLELAIKAEIPIISATTTDPLNLPDVLSEIAGVEVFQVPPGKTNQQTFTSNPAKVFWSYGVEVTGELYTRLAQLGKVLILVNEEEPSPLAFPAGAIPTPKTLVRKFLAHIALESEIEPLAACFSGLTLKDLGEVARLTIARDGALTPKGVLMTRALVVAKVQGLHQVDTALDVYEPFTPLEQWLSVNAKFFTQTLDPRLTPRGVLLNGPAGTGKTTAAKYLSNRLNVPLYRIDVSSILGKYVGESESRFSALLSTLDREEPAVVLVDEVEKLFQGNGDSGVSQRILSNLLWWMAERTSRLLVVLTCNSMDDIPPELYREGRIDKIWTVRKLDLNEAITLAWKVLKSYTHEPSKDQMWLLTEELKAIIYSDDDKRISHAHVTQVVKDWVKLNLF